MTKDLAIKLDAETPQGSPAAGVRAGLQPENTVKGPNRARTRQISVRLPDDVYNDLMAIVMVKRIDGRESGSRFTLTDIIEEWARGYIAENQDCIDRYRKMLEVQRRAYTRTRI